MTNILETGCEPTCTIRRGYPKDAPGTIVALAVVRCPATFFQLGEFPGMMVLFPT